MTLEELYLFQFKNYREARLHIAGRINCFVGKNGSGKTNLLDAIHYLTLTKSAFDASDMQNILEGERQFALYGVFRIRERLHPVSCAFTAGQKKMMTENETPVTRFVHHIGRFPVIIITPMDINLIWGGSEGRRRFFDGMLAQMDGVYLERLIAYNHTLKQRNAYLRGLLPQEPHDRYLIENYNRSLSEAGAYIHACRKRLLESLIPRARDHYQYLTEGGEDIGIAYESDLQTDEFNALLEASLPRDRALQRTCVGIHRDEFTFLLNQFDIRKRGSQGQQKSFLVAVKFSEYQLMFEKKGQKPLLLLDDIFDKLDDHRIGRLLERLNDDNAFGQIFITDARPERCRGVMKNANISAYFYEINEGNIKLASA